MLNDFASLAAAASASWRVSQGRGSQEAKALFLGAGSSVDDEGAAGSFFLKKEVIFEGSWAGGLSLCTPRWARTTWAASFADHPPREPSTGAASVRTPGA